MWKSFSDKSSRPEKEFQDKSTHPEEEKRAGRAKQNARLCVWQQLQLLFLKHLAESPRKAASSPPRPGHNHYPQLIVDPGISPPPQRKKP